MSYYDEAFQEHQRYVQRLREALNLMWDVRDEQVLEEVRKMKVVVNGLKANQAISSNSKQRSAHRQSVRRP